MTPGGRLLSQFHGPGAFIDPTANSLDRMHGLRVCKSELTIREDFLKFLAKKTAGRRGTRGADRYASPPTQRHEGRRMQADAADRDDHLADVNLPNSAADDTGTHDVFDLWRDLGGSD